MFFADHLACSVDGCDRHVYAKTYCKWHYIRSRKYDGDPIAKAVYPSSKRDFIADALAAARAGENDCILWPFFQKKESRSIDFRNVDAKRLWLSAVAEKDNGFLVHTCGNPLCVNLNHWAVNL